MIKWHNIYTMCYGCSKKGIMKFFDWFPSILTDWDNKQNNFILLRQRAPYPNNIYVYKNQSNFVLWFSSALHIVLGTWEPSR